jgi:hypothetical protein
MANVGKKEPEIGKRKRMVPIGDIEVVLKQMQQVSAHLVVILKDLKQEKITDIEFDGVGLAERGMMALGSYASAIRGAITDPKSQKVYAGGKK